MKHALLSSSSGSSQNVRPTSSHHAADFLKLMKDHLIVTDLIGKDEYFMPCLLRTMEPQEIDQHRASCVVPLAIHFPCQLVPHGVFCSLVEHVYSVYIYCPICMQCNISTLLLRASWSATNRSVQCTERLPCKT